MTTTSTNLKAVIAQPKSDKERLNAAFKQLRAHKFVAKQNFLCCQTCGWAEIGAEPKDALFYHRQDTEHALKDGKLVSKLYIAHRISSEGRGLLVRAIFADNGFYAIWDGSDSSRIALVNMTLELKAISMLRTADRVCSKDGHEWGWQLQARELIKNAEKSIGVRS